MIVYSTILLNLDWNNMFDENPESIATQIHWCFLRSLEEIKANEESRHRLHFISRDRRHEL